MIKENNLEELSFQEKNNITGGNPFVVAFVAIGAVAAAGVAIYDAGVKTGEFIYEVTH